MINFEEELKNFEPSPEISEAEDAIHSRDLTDMTDIIGELLRSQKLVTAVQGNEVKVNTQGSKTQGNEA